LGSSAGMGDLPRGVVQTLGAVGEMLFRLRGKSLGDTSRRKREGWRKKKEELTWDACGKKEGFDIVGVVMAWWEKRKENGGE